jgi:hypothetical protein
MAMAGGASALVTRRKNKKDLTGHSVSTPATDATASVPPATPVAVMTMARTTRKRAPRIHDHHLSFPNHFIQAARDARIEGHRLNRGRSQGKTCCCSHRAAQNSTQQSPAINRFHRLLSLLVEMRLPPR